MSKQILWNQKFWIVASLMSISLLAVAQKPSALQPTANGDLFASQLIAAPISNKDSVVEREPVSLSWGLDSVQELSASQAPHVSESREYWLEAASVDFRDGISITTTQPGALVRISPLPGDGLEPAPAIDPIDLVLVNEAGRVFSGGSGMDLLVSPERLEAAGQSPFSSGTSAFRIGAETGEGALLLYGDNMDHGKGGSYLIHVREQNSDWALRLRTGADSYFPNQWLTVYVQMVSAKGTLPPAAVHGIVVSPSGRRFPLRFHGEMGRLRLGEFKDEGPGLWRVEVSAKVEADGLQINRGAQTAFAYALPTARVTGALQLSQDKSGIRANLGLEVASSGRYELRGVLYGSDPSGIMKPMAMAHSADWLPAGKASLTLTFDGSLSEASTLAAPYEIRDLRLIHQDRFALLHRQTTALRFE